MVFCYQNVLTYCEKKLKFEAKDQEFANFLRSQEQFIRTVKGQNNFGMPFKLIPEGLSDLIHWSNYISN